MRDQKGCGWLLKETGKTHSKDVIAFVMDRQDEMPRVSFRYALEKLPEQMRLKAMGKGR
jgi:3-methyladenine DNA glycosylase AlkD